MPRLIDADALNIVLFPLEENEYERGWNDAIEAVMDYAHTIDAAPVVHGRWVCLEPEIGYYACSRCDHRILRAKCNFCPNCGAKMDGDGNG